MEKQQEKTARETTQTGKSFRAIRKTDTEQGQQKTKNTCKVNEVCFRFRPQKIEEKEISRWATPFRNKTIERNTEHAVL